MFAEIAFLSLAVRNAIIGAAAPAPISPLDGGHIKLIDKNFLTFLLRLSPVKENCFLFEVIFSVFIPLAAGVQAR